MFGANTNTLEAFLIGNKIKGPCWLEVKNPAVPQQKLSFCTIEVRHCIGSDRPSGPGCWPA